MSKPLASLLVAVLMAGTLSACGVQEEQRSAVHSNGRYGSAAGLRKAAVELGYECPDWRVTPEQGLAQAIGLASSSGTCDGEDQFLVYGSRQSYSGHTYTVRDQLDYWQSEFDTVPGTHTILGPNWIITFGQNSKNYKSLAKRLKGKVHH